MAKETAPGSSATEIRVVATKATADAVDFDIIQESPAKIK